MSDKAESWALPLGGLREGRGWRGGEQSCVGADVPVTRRKVMTRGGDSAKSLRGSVPYSTILLWLLKWFWCIKKETSGEWLQNALEIRLLYI